MPQPLRRNDGIVVAGAPLTIVAAVQRWAEGITFFIDFGLNAGRSTTMLRSNVIPTSRLGLSVSFKRGDGSIDSIRKAGVAQIRFTERRLAHARVRQ
jgi:hypothetical protein